MKQSYRQKLLAVATVGLLSGGLAHAAEINVIENATFPGDTYYPWAANVWAGAATADVRSGGNPDNRFCLEVTTPSSNEWDINLRHEGIPLVAGQTYEFSAEVWATTAVEIKVATGSPDADFHFGTFGNADSPHFDVEETPLAGAPLPISRSFVAPTQNTDGPLPAETTGWFDFQLGGGLAPAGATVCFDNIQLITEAEEKEPEVAESPVEINQHGYLPGLPMKSVYALPDGVNDTQTPRAWALYREGSTTAVQTGTTSHHGSYGPAGQHLHLIDFTDNSLPHGNYHLEVTEPGVADAYSSHTFSVGADLYSDLKYEALAYFYHNRSNAEIEADVVGSEWARGKGHTQDDAVQTIACKDGSTTHDCLTIDVSGGWYDAGDHGKYVVNGGISAWTLMNQYERAKHLGANLADFADGSNMALPAGENSDGVSDILNEAAWEVKWLMKMQVPEGTNAGMVYHKMHSEVWANVPWDPSSQDAYDEKRYIWGPSTAATLNFAAVGAQCYRVFKGTGVESDDPSYTTLAEECLNKAVLAYETAVATPYVPSPPETEGGGAYPDGSGGAGAVEDEYYWAATELYLATYNTEFSRDTYGSAMNASPDNLSFGEYATHQSVMNWQNTSALGVLSLATVGEAYDADAYLGSNWTETARDNVVATGLNYATAATGAPYGIPFDPSNMYWGSNSNVLNNMLVMGLARDFTCDTATFDTALQQSMHYLLGLNPLDRSYVSGYGERTVRKPHHRFWADQGSFPAVPPGVVAGGPNGDTESWTEKEESFLPGCEAAPLTCYMDDISSYATNEITINWNAPLAWAVAYMDEVASGKVSQSCGGVIAVDGVLDLGVAISGQKDLKTLYTNGSALTYEIVDFPQSGTLNTDNLSNGIVGYTADSDTVSSDAFTYRVYDSGAGAWSEPATITVNRDTTTTAACNFDVTMEPHQYSDYWQGEIAIENTSSEPLNGWEVILEFPAGTVTHGAWGPQTESLGDNKYRISSQAWNETIHPGGAYIFGLSGSVASAGDPVGTPVLSGETCGEPVEKTLLLDETIDGGIFYHLLPLSHFFNATDTPDEDIIGIIDGETFDLSGLFCCRGNFFMHQRGITLGEHTVTITTGSGLPEEEDTGTFTFSNAMASCSLENVQDWGTSWQADVRIHNRGYVLGTRGRYTHEWAAPDDTVLKGDRWMVTLAWAPQLNSQDDGEQKNVRVPDESAHVYEQHMIMGDGLDRFNYYLTAGDRRGVIEGHDSTVVTIQGDGSFYRDDGTEPYVGCSFGNYSNYNQ